MFTAYLYYVYKIQTQFEYTNRRHSKHLLILAITMGASIGVSVFIWIFSLMVGLRDTPIATISGAFVLLIQQCVIMISFMCMPKMSQLCKELFSKNKQQP